MLLPEVQLTTTLYIMVGKPCWLEYEKREKLDNSMSYGVGILPMH